MCHYRMNIDQNTAFPTVNRKLTARDDGYLDFGDWNGTVTKRDNCESNVDYQTAMPWVDWFG